ncbi:BREX-1 system phosphatase PglZ type A [Adlercreutzia agrestimuris]|uniref:BREX-1 system phosphatase PglZ type A n=1 Tax=Adlercreutzia agrestimuris TaxID=2941324 RepID=UPI00203EB150|nr:BREX-1 system phosphatase PglZ type A [Adlercreutzia agrestimuris]
MTQQITEDQAIEIAGRLAAYFDGKHRLVFWEDEDGGYSEILDNLSVDGATIVDVTGRELSSKRRILRDERDGKFVIYRQGALPAPADDFLYDLKLAALPFNVSMEGIWAEECDIPVNLSGDLNAYARFFSSAERKQRLRDSVLPKSTPNDLAKAILAACVTTPATHWRDALRDVVKKVVSEWAEDNNTTYKLICDCALETRFWSEVESVLGYAPSDGNPTIDDLAFEMLASTCKSILPPGTTSVTADAERILAEMASNTRKRDAYDSLIEKCAQSLVDLIPDDSRTPEAIGQLDSISQFDQWVLTSLADSLVSGTLRHEQIDQVLSSRSSSQWFERYEDNYHTLLSACSFFDAIASYESTSPSVSSAQDIFELYCNTWYEVDESYRHFFAHYANLQNGKFKQKLETPKQRIISSYDQYLMTLTDKWQLALFADGDPYPPQGIVFQAHFFKERVAHALPSSEKGRRVGIIISDALRYEVGRELASRISRSRNTKLRDGKSVSCEGALCMLPSYTQLGMAALLPGDTMEIDPATGSVVKDGMPTSGLANRQKILDSTVPGSIAIKADALRAEGPTAIGDAASIIYVYHNVIDKMGDSRDTEDKVFSACEAACRELEGLASELVSAGCGTVFITSDHGFLYQSGDIAAYEYAEVEGLSMLSKVEDMEMNRTRRFIVADTLPKSDALIEYASDDLSLKGNAKVAFPRGITRLRLRGSGAKFVHGGASLQEGIIPIISIKRDVNAKKTYETDVQGFATGRLSITGSTVAVDVYQVQPCDQSILPVTVKVGLYAPDDSESPGKLLSATEKTLVLESENKASDARKSRVTLDVTNDIDSYRTAMVRISKQVGQTKKHKSVWEQEYSVDRGFGNDFDF